MPDAADCARSLRAFARRIRDSRFRGTERYLADMDDLAVAMLREANLFDGRPAVPKVQPGRFVPGPIVIDRHVIQAEFRRRRRG